MCKQGNSHDHIYLDQRARLFYSQMLAKGLFNKKSLSVSTWHVGWHHTWEKERCKSVFSHKLQSWKCFHIKCFLFLILSVAPWWEVTPENFLLLIFYCFCNKAAHWKTLPARLPPLSSRSIYFFPHGTTWVLSFQQGLEICFATEFGKFKQYLNPACCLYFFDSGVAGNIGNLHSLWILQNPTYHRNFWELVIEDNQPEEKGSNLKCHGVNDGEMNVAVLEQVPGWILPSKRL